MLSPPAEMMLVGKMVVAEMVAAGTAEDPTDLTNAKKAPTHKSGLTGHVQSNNKAVPNSLLLKGAAFLALMDILYQGLFYLIPFCNLTIKENKHS